MHSPIKLLSLQSEVFDISGISMAHVHCTQQHRVFDWRISAEEGWRLNTFPILVPMLEFRGDSGMGTTVCTLPRKFSQWIEYTSAMTHWVLNVADYCLSRAKSDHIDRQWHQQRRSNAKCGTRVLHKRAHRIKVSPPAARPV